MTSQTLNLARSRLNASYRNLTLWTLQGWIAMFFFAAGYAKLTEPTGALARLMRWPGYVAPDIVHGLGVAEIVMASLVLAPLVSWRHGGPLLLAATAGLIGLESVMLAIHAAGGDIGPASTNVVLLAITVPVLWFRTVEMRAAG